MTHHVQNAKPYSAISHGEVRELTRLAITRAREINWPLFVALRYGAGAVCCFGAAMAFATFDFLSASAKFSFPPSAPPQSCKSDSPLSLVWDDELRAALEKFLSRSSELGYSFFIGLRVPAQTSRKTPSCQCHWRLLPRENAEHLTACFHVVMNLADSSPQPSAPKSGSGFAN